MSFVRGKSSMGPRGRNVSTSRQVTAMGYTGDDHSFTRGPGAIAALDAASPRRRIARARQLHEDARRDAARARSTMGALPIAPVIAKAVIAQGVKTMMPGQRMTSIRPGTVQVAKYPGVTGYVPPKTYGAPTKVRMPGAVTGSVRSGIRTSSSPPSAILGTNKPGLSTTPGSIVLPAAGNVNPITGQVDPGSAGGGTATSSGGGGGGGTATLPDGTDAADGGTDDTTQSTDPGTSTDPSADGGGGGALAPLPDPGTMVAPAPADTTPSTTTRNWLIAGAVLLGGYWLLKKR